MAGEPIGGDKTELAKTYDPKTVEDKWYGFWRDHGIFHAEPDPARKPDPTGSSR